MAASGNGVVVVFDFDKTIIDCDSDNWVVDALGATARFDELLRRLPWNSAVDAVMGELHAEGRSVEEIRACLRTVPLSPRVAAAVEIAHTLGCELRVLSDANAIFVDTVLEHHGLEGYFSAVDTNPAFVDGDGRLRVLPYHGFHGPSAAGHGCALPTCPPNMCKGKVMERIMEESLPSDSGGDAPAARRVVYLGDGRGDYCPSLKLTRRDYVMPRKGYPVWDLIASDRAAVRANVREWDDFDDLEAVLLNIIGECLTSDDGGCGGDDEAAASVVAAAPPTPPVECRALAPSTASAHEAILRKAVHVPN
ncbi:hypothetical protein GUJ93_ZPchr0006g41320 [Zizania palustris]|uniref:Phosphatase n=1 Tax=Zizania palustris TaxID=103762 RepID=A0A8J5SVV2_ZIZPA|nr:hypothetical protein GUJ93_ZPchr0006g41320 [Zizania palustris]